MRDCLNGIGDLIKENEPFIYSCFALLSMRTPLLTPFSVPHPPSMLTFHTVEMFIF